ncbi:ATP-binding protein [Streptomyces fenghuangensis]|uniref:ATP-binding protein n=1 Tax=Streptomyces TaxID=1883 RepID=UPI001EDB381D|nr:ATP-binding protein [Streptomyces sp. ICN903]MCG3039006.1 ATP-binding protein [Streptomyces sp. ICN903]
MPGRDPQLVGERITARLARIVADRGSTAGTTPADRVPEPVPTPAAVEDRIPPRYRGAVADHPKVESWVREVASKAAAPSSGARRQVGTGPSLLLAGPTGTGKTHQAYGAIRSLVATGVGVRWQATTEADLYAGLRLRLGAEAERELAALARCPVLILDDLGAARSSEWTEEIVYRLINRRYNDMLPTLVTTNLAIAELRKAVGDRVASRLAEMTERVVLTGSDRRRRPAA